MGIRTAFPDVFLVFSASTSSGSKVARQVIADRADLLIPFPFDILPVTALFIRHIHPDLFILVETDFWPNFMSCLYRRQIPAMLVNGRISQASVQSYRRAAFFFRPMFLSFHHLCMQTEADRANMMDLGVPAERVHTLGNLKFDTSLVTTWGDSPTCPVQWVEDLPDFALLMVAGSTHKGEEQILLSVYKRLLAIYPTLFLVIAPRNISRGRDIQDVAAAQGIRAVCRSEKTAGHHQVLILDSIGELAGVYRYADIAFVGGSLVPCGGHNPIEPAVMGAPVLFGGHMEDFAEISQELLAAGGAVRVGGKDSLFQAISDWLADARSRKDAGQAARRCVERQQGVVERHLRLIHKILLRDQVQPTPPYSS
jgi:3-deoxy-D-manno-octulosonic-acid transferase